MSNMFAELDNLIGKVKYQEFNIELLTESFSVYIPYTSKEEFLKEINLEEPSTKKQVTSIVKKFNGKLN